MWPPSVATNGEAAEFNVKGKNEFFGIIDPQSAAYTNENFPCKEFLKIATANFGSSIP